MVKQWIILHHVHPVLKSWYHVWSSELNQVGKRVVLLLRSHQLQVHFQKTKTKFQSLISKLNILVHDVRNLLYYED